MREIFYELPVNQAIALRAGLILTDPMLEQEISDGYIRQEVRRRVAEKMKRYE